MKSLLHENGQPYMKKSSLDWEHQSTESAMRDRVLDITTPGAIWLSGPAAAAAPFIITPATALSVDVGPGLAYGPNSSWPVGITADTEPSSGGGGGGIETGGERIRVSSGDGLWYRSPDTGVGAHDGTGPFTEVSDGVTGGTWIAAPQSTGRSSIPVTGATALGAPVVNAIWISYMETVKIGPGDSCIDKLDPNHTKKIYPYVNDGYDIVVTIGLATPGTKYMLLGTVTVPPAAVAITSSMIDQTQIQYADLRDQRSVGQISESQADSHSNGIVSILDFVPTLDTYETHEIVKVSYNTARAFYVDGHRGTVVAPQVGGPGACFTYSAFLAGVDAAGQYDIFIERQINGTFFLRRGTVNVPVTDSQGIPVARVDWSGISLSNLVDLRVNYIALTNTINIRDGAVTYGKIATETIVNSNISTTAGIVVSKLALPSGNIIVGSTGGAGKSVGMTGDVRIDSNGVATIQLVSVTDAQIAPGVAPAKLALADGKIIVGDTGGFGAEVGMTGHATISNTGVVTVSPSVRVPVGGIILYGSGGALPGWLVCNGQACNVALNPEYTDLYNIIGTSFGGVYPSFLVPNLQERFPLGYSVGSGPAIGGTGGAATVVLQPGELPDHTHYSDSAVSWGALSGGHGVRTVDRARTTDATIVGATGGAHQNMPPYLVLNYIIKY